MKTLKTPSHYIDDYIASAPEFARQICIRLRELIHRADPDIKEEWKWGPNFQKQGMICGFGYFKNHVTLTFFRGDLLKDAKGILTGESNIHNRSIKFKSTDDVNDKVILSYIKEAVKIDSKKLPDGKYKTVEIPDDFKKLLKKRNLLEKFEAANYTNRKEFINWILSAKKEETRLRRIEKAIVKISKGEKFS